MMNGMTINEVTQITSPTYQSLTLKNNIQVRIRVRWYLINFIVDKNTDQRWWRFCLSYQDSPENPFLEPCKCSGTMRNIHFECLKAWLDNNKKVKSNKYHTVVMYSTIACDLWKEEFPIKMKKGKKIINLLSYHEPETKNYIVFETLMCEEVFEEKIRVYHTFEFKTQNEITLGRKNETHWKISDMSISRLHCSFHLINKCEVWIEDIQSKFGTLVLMKKTLRLSPSSKPFWVQVGRSYLKIEWKLPPEWWSVIMKPQGIKFGVTTWM